MLRKMLQLVQTLLVVLGVGLSGSVSAWADDEARGPTSPAARPVAEVAALVGKATVTRGVGTTPIPLALGDALYERDLIKTAEDSKAKIRFAEDSVATLGPLGTLVLVVAHVRLADGQRQVTLSMTTGVIRALVGLLGSQDTFILRTPTAQCTVRGTEFGAILKPDSAGFFVKQGKVVVTNRDPEVQGEVILTDAEGTDVGMGQPPTNPKKWGAARVNALLEATTIPETPGP